MRFLGKNAIFHDPLAAPRVSGEITTTVARPGERW